MLIVSQNKREYQKQNVLMDSLQEFKSCKTQPMTVLGYLKNYGEKIRRTKINYKKLRRKKNTEKKRRFFFKYFQSLN